MIPKVSLFVTLLLLALLQGGQAGSESQCCSDCNEIKRNSMIGGFQAFYLRTSIRAYMMRNMPFSLIANLVSNMPSNITQYLAARSKDLEERQKYQLLTWKINVNESTGLDSEIPPYASLDPAFVTAMILGINKTVAANIMGEDPNYIEFKLKYIQEFLAKYKEWYSGSRYSRTKDQKKKANVAAMALIMSDVLQFGYEEQVIMKTEVQYIYDSCVEVTDGKDKRTSCYNLPKSRDWKKGDNEKVLKGFNIRERKHLKGQMNRLTYAIRNDKRLFIDNDGDIAMDYVGYFFIDRNNTISREERPATDFTKAIHPMFYVHQNGDPAVDDDDILNLIQSLNLERIVVNGIGSFSDPDFRPKWMSLQSYLVSTLYSPFLAYTYKDQFYNSMKNTCVAKCRPC